MDSKPFGKRMLSKLTKPFKSKSHKQRPIAGQHGDSLGVDQPDRSVSAPPDIPQDSAEQVHISMPTISVVAQSTESLILDPINSPSDAPPSGQTFSTAQIGEDLAATVTPAPILTVRTTEVAMLPSLKPSPAMQTAKFVGKGLLGLLSSATEGVPVPGVKGIFDTILKVINVIEVGHMNNHY
jgi:hypothetical protein